MGVWSPMSFTTIGMIALGVFAILSMVMMIGNVLSKGKYGGAWAAFGGVCVLLAGVFLLLSVFMPKAEAQDASSTKTTTAATDKTTPEDTKEPKDTSQSSTGIGANKPSQDAGQDLSWLTSVMAALKDGQPIPAEYLAMLPDGGKGIAAQQAAAGQNQGLSKPLTSQLVSIARDQGRTSPKATATNYVPQNPSSNTATPPSSTGGTGAGTPSTSPGTSAGSAGSGSKPNPDGGNTSTPPVTPPPVTPPPVTPPPVTPPPVTPPPVTPPAAGTLVDGGLLKSVLGASKAQVQEYFRYNQSLGQDGNVLSYYRGSMMVQVTMNGDTATRVSLIFDRFTPSGQDRTYYETYMMGMAGMSESTPTSRNGQNASWVGVYPGASSISFTIDLASNSGRIDASR